MSGPSRSSAAASARAALNPRSTGRYSVPSPIRGASTPAMVMVLLLPPGPALVAAREAGTPWKCLMARYGLSRTRLFEIYRGELDARRGHLARGVDHLRRSIEGLERGLGEIEAEIARLDELIEDPRGEG